MIQVFRRQYASSYPSSSCARDSRAATFNPCAHCAKAATGLVRLPNSGAVKWRKADDSGDLGMALNAGNHLAMDAIIDWAPGQTFGSLTVPDATTLSKGVVQIDPVGGMVVAAGVLSSAGTGVTPGAYTKTTVDAKGRVTAGATRGCGPPGAYPFRVRRVRPGAHSRAG